MSLEAIAVVLIMRIVGKASYKTIANLLDVTDSAIHYRIDKFKTILPELNCMEGVSSCKTEIKEADSLDEICNFIRKKHKEFDPDWKETAVIKQNDGKWFAIKTEQSDGGLTFFIRKHPKEKQK